MPEARQTPKPMRRFLYDMVVASSTCGRVEGTETGREGRRTRHRPRKMRWITFCWPVTSPFAASACCPICCPTVPRG
eukprot:3483965-Rhodomonas_salina.1